ncbi:MAG TPA: SAM-dependent methyltransferase [Pyrinomonadaceae bacterium]|nr:SAM-dependent methyltransferase [Pyrinomonadaceae bacterium]
MSDAVANFIKELRRSITANEFVKLTLSNYKGAEPHLQKVSVRTVETKKGTRLFFQYRHDTRDISKNYDATRAIAQIQDLIESGFRSGHLFTTSNDFQLTVGKKSSRLVTGKPTLKRPASASHDRQKKSLIDPNAFYLKALGIATDEGEIRARQQDKWRQINKYVEILGGLFDKSQLKDKQELRIVDMGSGKGYLTFAAYDYFANVRGLDLEMTGVEVRQELVDLCNQIAQSADFDGLKFVNGSIADVAVPEADILVALHACDTATDDALFKGITANAQIIVAAPCCHKELRPQIKPPDVLKDILKHGSMLEREAETITDGLRSMLLERSGYSTKVFEFVPTEHTPKNNMIVATRDRPDRTETERLQAQIDAVKALYGIREQRLENLLA